MKILHCCLAAFYIDNYGYQENILPRMHKIQGHEIEILASTETFIDNAIPGYLLPSSYYTKDGIPITRLPYCKMLPHFVMRKLRIYKGISQVLEKFHPDIIFLHGLQFISIIDIVSYAKKFPQIRIFIDGHTDFINSARSWPSRIILHGIIYKWCARKIKPYTKKFYGVLPLRVDFFKNVYGVSDNQVELLELGADDSVFDLSMKDEIRRSIRKKLDISESDFVIITGGKIDHRKNIHTLMKAFIQLNIDNMKLIVFGAPVPKIGEEIDELSKAKNIRNIGWIPSEKTYDYFFSSDLAFFPGTHSVLWEQAVGVGLPCVFKKWEGMQHVDLNGNCIFINSANLDEIKEIILLLYQNNDLLLKMKKIAREKGIPKFSYYQIAKKAIEG